MSLVAAFGVLAFVTLYVIGLALFAASKDHHGPS